MRPFAVLCDWLHSAIDVLAPEACAACDGPVRRRRAFCSSCARDITECAAGRIPEGTVPVLSAASYAGPVAEAVRRLKYSDRPDLADNLGRWVAERVDRALLPRDTVLVPVPLHPRRLSERGFNQSALLAREEARAWDIPLEPGALRRVRDTAQQAMLGREERLENVRSAFGARGRLDGRAVAIFDDVVTTGATALGCAGALRRAGANVVAVVTLARAGS